MSRKNEKLRFFNKKTRISKKLPLSRVEKSQYGSNTAQTRCKYGANTVPNTAPTRCKYGANMVPNTVPIRCRCQYGANTVPNTVPNMVPITSFLSSWKHLEIEQMWNVYTRRQHVANTVPETVIVYNLFEIHPKFNWHRVGTVMAPYLAPCWHRIGTVFGTVLAPYLHRVGAVFGTVLAPYWHRIRLFKSALSL